MARLFRSGDLYAQIEIGSTLACITVGGDQEHCHITDRREVDNAYKCIQVLQKEFPQLLPWRIVL